MTTTARRLTLAEYLALPEQKPYLEYACGEVSEKPMGDDFHGMIQVFLAGLLRAYLLTARTGKAVSEWRCVFGPPGRERAFIPDIVYATWERYSGRGSLRAAPDLAVEVLSPGQPAGRFAAKVNFYLRHGVRLVWIVDPDRREVVVLSAADEARTLRPGDTLAGGDVLPGFAVPVADIFAELDVQAPPPQA